MSPLSYEGGKLCSLEELADKAVSLLGRAHRESRVLLGIAGPPAAGKSTFSKLLASSVNARHEEPTAAVAPMDGFHLTNRELDSKGLRSRKGHPETFSADSFVSRLERLKVMPNTEAYWPRYDRTLHEPVPNAITIAPSARLVITEGNYLLLDYGPWRRLKNLLDEAWYLDEDEEVIVSRLSDRHRAAGRSVSELTDKINGSDLPNARLVAGTKVNADLWLRLVDEGQYMVCTPPR